MSRELHRAVRRIAHLGAAAIMVTGCSHTSTGPGGLQFMTEVAREVNTVFMPTFDSLNTQSARLATQLSSLAATPTSGALTEAQSTWRTVRATYAFSGAFAYGPVQTYGVESAIDTWPVDTAGIDAELASSDSLTVSLVHGLPATLKGFHAVEYVLFGGTGNATATSLSARQLQFLAAAGQDVANELALLDQAWSPDGANYGAAVISAGQAGSEYQTSEAALQDMVVQWDLVPGQMAAKFASPLATDSAIYEESPYSNNTLADIQNAMAGTAAVYGHGLGVLVAAKDGTLDATVRQQISSAETAINAITPNFATALQNDPNALQQGENAVLSLQLTITQLVTPLLGVGSAPPLGPQSDND